MLIRSLADGISFDAPNHRNVLGSILQTVPDAHGTQSVVCFSQYLPGGGAGPDSTPFDKLYVVLNGQLKITAGGQDRLLGPMDSCLIPAGEVRDIVNPTKNVVSLLVVLLSAPKTPD